jgi:hypothetical protein
VFSFWCETLVWREDEAKTWMHRAGLYKQPSLYSCLCMLHVLPYYDMHCTMIYMCYPTMTCTVP